MGMEPQLCWVKFVGATGSDLIDKFTYIFLDAIDLGGDATKVGKLVNTTNLEVVLLRMKRKLVSASFTTLVISDACGHDRPGDLHRRDPGHILDHAHKLYSTLNFSA